MRLGPRPGEEYRALLVDNPSAGEREQHKDNSDQNCATKEGLLESPSRFEVSRIGLPEESSGSAFDLHQDHADQDNRKNQRYDVKGVFQRFPPRRSVATSVYATTHQDALLGLP